MYRIRYEMIEIGKRVGNIAGVSVKEFETISAAEQYAYRTVDLYKGFEEFFQTWYHQETEIIPVRKRVLRASGVILLDINITNAGTNKNLYRAIINDSLFEYLASLPPIESEDDVDVNDVDDDEGLCVKDVLEQI